MKCSVKQRGKFFIVVDPFQHESYTLNNRLGAESLVVTLNKLYEENKGFKQVINEVLKLLEEEVDLFSDKATEHDIQAYIELNELDNKDAYYMAISTKKAIKILRGV